MSPHIRVLHTLAIALCAIVRRALSASSAPSANRAHHHPGTAVLASPRMFHALNQRSQLTQLVSDSREGGAPADAQSALASQVRFSPLGGRVLCSLAVIAGVPCARSLCKMLSSILLWYTTSNNHNTLQKRAWRRKWLGFASLHV